MNDDTTIIGETITVTGDFKSQEDVSVRGKVVGRFETTADLVVEDGGAVEAEVMTRSVDVNGTIVGDVVASDRFEIHPGGTVVGDIRAPRVILSDGCKYRGRIEVTDG